MNPYPFDHQRRYKGPVQAVIFDWAGTTVDFGCMAPAIVFQKIVEEAGVPITIEEAREPMGTHKRVHISEILSMPRIQTSWTEVHGNPPDQTTVDNLYNSFLPLQLECLTEHSQLIPGTLEIVEKLRNAGCKIGSTTGYSREIMEALEVSAVKLGFKPDVSVCASDVTEGRPSPFMLFKCLTDLGIYPVESCIKVDDTVSGIEEGLNAGCWTVAVTISGNDVGMPYDQWQQAETQTKEMLRVKSYKKQSLAGAHFVIDSINDLMPCVQEINRRLSMGIKP